MTPSKENLEVQVPDWQEPLGELWGKDRGFFELVEFVQALLSTEIHRAREAERESLVREITKMKWMHCGKEDCAQGQCVNRATRNKTLDAVLSHLKEREGKKHADGCSVVENAGNGHTYLPGCEKYPPIGTSPTTSSPTSKSKNNDN